MQLWSNPLASAFPFPYSFLPPLVSLYLLGTLLAVIGSCPPRSQVARKLISPFPSPSPYTPRSKIPTPLGFPELNMHITKTTSRTWLTRSRTLPPQTKKENIFIKRRPSVSLNSLQRISIYHSYPISFENLRGVNRSGFLSQLSCVLGTTVKSVGYPWHIPGKKLRS